MKIPFLNLAEGDIRLIKRVAIFSFILCFSAVAITWILNSIKARAKSKAIVEHAQPSIEAAAFYAEKSKDLLPVDIEAHNLAAEYYIKTDQSAKAISHLLRIAPLRKADRAFGLQLATAYIQSGMYDYAATELQKQSEVPVADSLTPIVDARYGITLYYLGSLEKSRELLTNCFQKYPTSAEAACYLGQIEAAIKTPSDTAEALLRTAIELDPRYAEAMYQLARYYMALTKYDKAQTYLQQILDIEPLHVKAHSRLGMVYYYLNQPVLAKKSYETALLLNPSDYNTYYNLGELYYSIFNDSKRALSAFKKTIKLNPTHSEANFKVGLICLGNNMVKEAIRYLEVAKAQEPSNIRILLQLGVAYEKIGLKIEALSQYKEVVELDGLNQVGLQKIKLLSPAK